jgi:oligoribonuclease
MSDGAADRLVWIDCEMTGLDVGADLLIEVAALVTDSELNVLGEGVDVVISATAEQLERMPEVVRDMHAASGLTEAVLSSTVTLQDAEQQVLAYIKEHVPEAKKAPLCGNSIATDRGFLTRDMPELDGWLHYRMVDVSSVKELARRWYPRAYYNAPRRAAGTGRWPTSASRSRSCSTTARWCSSRSPGRAPQQAAAAAAAVLGGDPDGASRTPAPSEVVPD